MDVEALDIGKLVDNLFIQLKATLELIEKYDTVYDMRYKLILQAMAIAATLGIKAGFRFDPKEPEWPVAYIELPTGQVTWHVAPHPIEWDGHSTEEKYKRVREFINQ